MTPNLILGPLLRHVGASDATVWVETDSPCEVEVLVGGSPHRSHTFSVEGHHYALVVITDLEPGSSHEYSIRLDGERAWPRPGYEFPAPVIRTIAPDDELTLVFGSCRVSLPQEPPYTNKRGKFARGVGGGFERDVLYALALRMRRQSREEWPDALLPPGEEVADFEEYTRLYWDAWKEPVIRWLLSTVPSAMIFDDHDVHDDWNTSETWVRQMRRKSWWEERIVGAFMSYWVYQHLGNLSPEELEEYGLFERVKKAQDASRVLREFAYRADRETGTSRWSFHRDFGRVRLIVMDTRAGRVLEEGHRSMLDREEWTWIEGQATGDFDHLLFGTSLPVFLAPGLHHLEAWNEAVCGGAWGRLATKLGEFVRQLVDMEHWAAFHDSFEELAALLRSVGAGERSNGKPPASVVVLSGDVHHGYLAEVGFGDGVESPVYQAVGSPLRNLLGLPERLAMRFGWSGPGERVGKTLARLAGVAEPAVNWRLKHEKPWFDNHISTLELRGREATLKVEKPTPEDAGEPRLRTILEHPLARDAGPQDSRLRARG